MLRIDDEREATVHWFYTFGTRPRPATYELPDKRQHSSLFLLPALLHLQWPDVPLDQVQFHGVVTSELLDTPNGPSAASQFLDAVPDALRNAVSRTWSDSPYLADQRDDEGLWGIVDLMLSVVQDGDVVLVELTNGLRHITSALLLGAGLLPALRPGVQLKAVTYAEFSRTGAPATVLDLSSRLELFRWSSALDAFSKSLDPRPLHALLKSLDKALWRSFEQGMVGRGSVDKVRDVVGALGDVGDAIALGWPEEVAAALSRVGRSLQQLQDGSVADALRQTGSVPAAHALKAAASRMLDLGQLTSPSMRLDRERLAFELDLVERLRDAGRHGDAIRILREWLVSATVLAHGEQDNWLEAEVRHRATARLFRRRNSEVGGLWSRVSEARNAASHGKTLRSHQNQTSKSIHKTLTTVTAALRGMLNDSLTAFRWPEGRPPVRWLASSFSLNMLPDSLGKASVRISEIRLEDVGALAMQSCVGHEDTAAVLSELLGQAVEANRQTVVLAPGDEVIVAQLVGPRLPAGAVTLPEGARFRWFHCTLEG